MELLLEVFSKLNINETFFIQFAIVIILFFILRALLFSKLQFVLELRESKTTKMEENANRKFSEAEKLAALYEERTFKSQKEAAEFFATERQKIVSKENQRVKKVEKEVGEEVEKARGANEEEVKKYREQLLQEVDSLASKLVDKVIQ